MMGKFQKLQKDVLITIPLQVWGFTIGITVGPFVYNRPINLKFVCGFMQYGQVWRGNLLKASVPQGITLGHWSFLVLLSLLIELSTDINYT